MDTKYRYSLYEKLTHDITHEQASLLEQDGFVFNNKMHTWDKYESVFEAKTFYHLEYKTFAEVEVPVHEYEISEINNNIFRVAYIQKKPSWLFGWFKSFLHIRTKEENVSDSRFNELLNLQAEGDITWLEKVITPKMSKKRIHLTEKEAAEYLNSSNPIKLINKNIWTKKEKRELFWETTIKSEEYNDFMVNKEEIGRREEIRQVEINKVLVDQREVAEIDIPWYIPGVWSRMSNHHEWTLANFKAKVRIKYISWFNPLDPEFISRKDLEEQIIEIIENEHPNTVYIREREDMLDGFKIEKSRIG